MNRLPFIFASLTLVFGLTSCSLTESRADRVERLKLRQAQALGVVPAEASVEEPAANELEPADPAPSTRTLEVSSRQPVEPAVSGPESNGSGTEFSLSLDEMSALIDSALPDSEPASIGEDATSAPANPEPAASAPQFSGLPYASPVPGKPGFVSLSIDSGLIPEIDVRGIAPGTPVEIPHPTKAGQTIKFKVP